MVNTENLVYPLPFGGLLAECVSLMLLLFSILVSSSAAAQLADENFRFRAIRHYASLHTHFLARLCLLSLDNSININSIIIYNILIPMTNTKRFLGCFLLSCFIVVHSKVKEYENHQNSKTIFIKRTGKTLFELSLNVESNQISRHDLADVQSDNHSQTLGLKSASSGDVTWKSPLV